MKNRIAFLLGSLNRGGTETLLLDVFRNAQQNQLDAIGIFRKTGVFEKEFKESGVEMHKLSVGKNPISYVLDLRRLLKNNNIHIAHAQQPIDALYVWLACLGTGIKVLLTFHGYDFADNRSTNIILRFIIKRTDTNIFVSDTQSRYYQQKYKLNPIKQKVVYNGISFEKFMSSTSVTQSYAPTEHKIQTLNRELNLKPDTLIMGTVGNFNDVRDQLSICRFLKLLKEQAVDFHFAFIGKRIDSMGNLYDVCVKYCTDNGLNNSVSFLGVRNDVPHILPQLDAFIYSTDHDTFGIAVVEAMAVGIPVFVNDWEVMTEITDRGRYATLYKTKDEEDLLRQFLLFLQNKPAYQAKAKDAATFVREKYSIEKHIQNLKVIYSSL